MNQFNQLPKFLPDIIYDVNVITNTQQIDTPIISYVFPWKRVVNEIKYVSSTTTSTELFNETENNSCNSSNQNESANSLNSFLKPRLTKNISDNDLSIQNNSNTNEPLMPRLHTTDTNIPIQKLLVRPPLDYATLAMINHNSNNINRPPTRNNQPKRLQMPIIHTSQIQSQSPRINSMRAIGVSFLAENQIQILSRRPSLNQIQTQHQIQIQTQSNNLNQQQKLLSNNLLLISNHNNNYNVITTNNLVLDSPNSMIHGSPHNINSNQKKNYISDPMIVVNHGLATNYISNHQNSQINSRMNSRHNQIESNEKEEQYEDTIDVLHNNSLVNSKNMSNTTSINNNLNTNLVVQRQNQNQSQSFILKKRKNKKTK